MKKAVLLIAILPLAAILLAANRARITYGYSPFAPGPVLDLSQKPKGDELTEEFHQSYPLTGTGKVGISNINGDVRIAAWDRDEVKVDAVKRGYSPQALSDMTIEVVNTPDSVSIKTKYPDRNFTRGNRDRENSYGSVEYVLTVPRRAQIDGAELVNGSLDIAGVEGDVHAALVNGRVKAVGLSGEVKLSTVNGSVEASVARLDDAKGVTLNSVNGSLTLYIPAGASAQVKANTIHGPITNDFGLPVNEGQYVGRDLNGQIGSGGPRVRLNNVNGPIAIKRGSAL